MELNCPKNWTLHFPLALTTFNTLIFARANHKPSLPPSKQSKPIILYFSFSLSLYLLFVLLICLINSALNEKQNHIRK